MSKSLKMLALAMVLAMALAPLAFADGSDAKLTFSQDAEVTGGFNDMSAGTVTVHLANKGEEPMKVTVVVWNYTRDDQLASEEAVVPAHTPGPEGEDPVPGTTECKLSFSFGSAGTKYVKIDVLGSDGEPIEGLSNDLTIEVAHSLWKDATTYVIIVVVVLAVGIALWLKLRGTPRADKGAKTFTELEEERKARKAGKKPAKVAEKKTYTEAPDKPRAKRK